MKIVIRRPKFDLWTVIMSAYLINQFYFTTAISVQRIVLLGTLFVYVFINYGYIRQCFNEVKKNNNIFVSLGLFALWMGAVVLTPFAHGTGDYSYIGYCVTFFSWTLYLLAIIIRLKKKNPNGILFDDFMRIFSLSIFLYVASTIIILVIPSLRTVIGRAVYNDAYSRMILTREKYYTRIGWAGFSGYTTSLKCTVSACFCLYTAVRNQIDGSNKDYSWIPYYLVSILGNVFYARTGLLVSIICTIVAIFYIAFRMGRIKAFIRYSMVVLAVVILFSLYLSSYTGENVVFNWIFELFVNSESGKGAYVISLDIMFNQMLFRPDNNTLLLGDGYYTGYNGFSYMRTDLGFMRLILYFGIPMMLLIYSIYTYNLTRLAKRGKTNRIGILSLMLFITFLLFEFKGESIVVLIPISFILLLIINCIPNSQLGD